MSSYGIPEEGIARLIINPRTGKPITAKTLRKHFREELDTGMTKANAQVVQTLFRQATGAPAEWKTMPDGSQVKVREEIKPIFQCAIYWTKARMGWREKSDVEVSGQDGGPIPLVVTKNQSQY